MYFSPSTIGFYSRALHGDAIPSDAVELTDAQYNDLIDGQSAGAQIVVGDDGMPALRAPVAPTPEDLRTHWRAGAKTQKGDFCYALVEAGILSPDEALSAAMGHWPAAFDGVLAVAPIPPLRAKLDWAAATEFGRMNPLFLAVLAFHAAQTGLTNDQAEVLGDTIFGWTDPAPATAPESGA